MTSSPTARLRIACLSCDGHGHTVNPTATTHGRTLAVPRKCLACDGTGKRRGFYPPV